ncbi:MAG: hypothetical protein ACT4N2_14825, partial [Hyphomicrobium sp.]
SLRFPAAEAGPEQVGVWSLIDADRNRVIDGLRDGIVRVAERLAKDCLEIYWPEHGRGLRALQQRAATAPAAGELSAALAGALAGLPVRAAVTRPICLGLLAAGRHAAGLALARHAYAREPALPWTAHTLALALSSAGLADEADTAFAALRAGHPDNISFTCDFARHLIKFGRFQRAVDLSRSALAAQPKSAALLHSSGLALEAAGDLPSAEKIMAEAVALEPANQQFNRSLTNVRTRLTVAGGGTAHA